MINEDFEHGHKREKGQAEAIKETEEQLLMQQLFEEEMMENSGKKGTIILGKEVKPSRFARYGNIIKKLFKGHI